MGTIDDQRKEEGERLDSKRSPFKVQSINVSHQAIRPG
jgi:hypothetical protein